MIHCVAFCLSFNGGELAGTLTCAWLCGIDTSFAAPDRTRLCQVGVSEYFAPLPDSPLLILDNSQITARPHGRGSRTCAGQ